MVGQGGRGGVKGWSGGIKRVGVHGVKQWGGGGQGVVESRAGGQRVGMVEVKGWWDQGGGGVKGVVGSKGGGRVVGFKG